MKTQRFRAVWGLSVGLNRKRCFWPGREPLPGLGDIEKRNDPVPKLSDLSEGGTIEQVAENVLFVYYDYKVKFNKSNIGKYGIQLFAAKVRYGETGQLILGFNGNRCRLYNSRDDVVYDS